MPAPESIVIVGGGFAGCTLLRALAPRMPDGWEVVLLSEESYTTFNPMLPEAVGASIFPEQVIAPIREMFAAGRRARFVMGSVTAVDAARGAVICSTLAGERRIDYRHLVFAFGNRARLDLIPGMAEHALPLKTVGDAMHIRNIVLRRLAQIELESDQAVRRRLGSFVVIGGGFSGVEVAGELVDCLRGIRRYYPRVEADELKVTVLQDLPHLLPELPRPLGAAALASLRQRGVDVRLESRASTIDGATVELASGESIAAGSVIASIGTRANPLLDALDVPAERGRIVVGPDLAVTARPGMWALGDCALVPNAYDGKPAPPTAQFAVREARHLAANLLAAIRSAPTTPFAHRSLGSMASIGYLRGVAEVFGIRLTGLPAWLLWRAYYLSQMPTLRRKLRIFGEWTWGMFFPPDVTHLRFTRSAEQQAPGIDPQGPASIASAKAAAKIRT